MSGQYVFLEALHCKGDIGHPIVQVVSLAEFISHRKKNGRSD